jgi:hypothetical protein
MKRLLLAISLIAAAAVQGQSQPDPSYERVLIPVFFFGGGVHGSQWWTELDIFNSGQPFDLPYAMLQANPACPTLCGCDGQKTVRSTQAETVCPIYEDTTGLILHVPRSVDRDDVTVQVRGLDRSRAADRYGSEIPVVWERDLLANPIMLLNIPTDNRYRSTLRLYDAYQYETTFTLRFFDMAVLRLGNTQPIFTTTVQARHDRKTDVSGGYHVRPAFVAIGNLAATYPQLASVKSVAIEVTGSDFVISPPPPSKRFYALASVTNNTTQEVTIVSPR